MKKVANFLRDNFNTLVALAKPLAWGLLTVMIIMFASILISVIPFSGAWLGVYEILDILFWIGVYGVGVLGGLFFLIMLAVKFIDFMEYR